jgi:hypothetical protein
MGQITWMNDRDLPDVERWFWVMSSMLIGITLFSLTWIISSRLHYLGIRKAFRKYDFKGKCDWCSRVPSVVHANVVLYFLWRENVFNVSWDEWFQTRNDLSVLERNMCISLGYFSYDLMVVLVSKMDLWQLYVFHHLAAGWPLVMVLFGGCQNYTFFGSGFFFVEMTIWTLQTVHWMETLKMAEHWLTKLAYHLTFWMWIPFRLVLPVYMTYNGVLVVMQEDDSVGFWQCKVPVGQGGFSIWFFCWLVFFAHIGPGYYRRIFQGKQPKREPAPAIKEREQERIARRKKTDEPQDPMAVSLDPMSPMSPAVIPTFKPSA